MKKEDLKIIDIKEKLERRKSIEDRPGVLVTLLSAVDARDDIIIGLVSIVERQQESIKSLSEAVGQIEDHLAENGVYVGEYKVSEESE